MLDQALDPALDRVPLLAARVADLLGEVHRIETEIAGPAAQPRKGARLLPGPGVEIALVEFGRVEGGELRGRFHRALPSF